MKTQTLAMATAALMTMAVLALAGCSSAQSDWAAAGNENTVAAYQKFLTKHPNDQHANEAQTMILQLQDDNAWAEAKHSGTIAAYQIYLQQSPQGSHAGEASDDIKALERAAAWKNAQVDSATSVKDFLQKYPTGPESDQAKEKLKELAGYRAHLATEASDAKAQRRADQLKAKFKDQLQELTVHPQIRAESHSRLTRKV